MPKRPRSSKPKKRARLPDRPKPLKVVSLRGDRSSSGGREWVGGVFSTTAEIEEHPGVHPEVLVWVERPEDTIVGGETKLPGALDTHLGTVLLRCMESPATGVPRRPTSIRVAAANLAAEVRSVIGDSIPIQVAPTPEIDEARRHLEEHLGESGDVGHLDEALPEPVVAELFRSVAAMVRARPWAVMHDRLLRLDIPALDIDGVCVNLAEAPDDQVVGMLLFPSREAQFALEAKWHEDHPGPGHGIDLGSGWLALGFAPRNDIPVTMREAMDQKGWEVAGRRWYPIVQSFDRFGAPTKVLEKDIRIITAVALASTAILPSKDGPTQSQPRPFDVPEFIPQPFDVPEFIHISDRNGMDIYLSGPWEAHDLPGPLDPAFEPYYAPPTCSRHSARRGAPDSGGGIILEPIVSGFGAPIQRMRRNRPVGFEPRASRNAPCPCGSGKKYKKCCLPSDLAGSETVHARDRRLIDDMQAFAFESLGVTWSDMTKDFTEAEAAAALAMDWSVYIAEHRDRPVVEWFLESDRLSPGDDRRWLEAQQKAWLSIWEVRKVVPGQGLRLQDALTGVVAEVEEAHASLQLERGQYLLARLVEFDGKTTISGLHRYPLPLVPAVDVILAMHRYLHRKRAVQPERLLPYRVARRLLILWEDALLHGDRTMWGVGGTTVDRQSVARAHRRNHFAGWPDLPIPALDDQTPREAVASEEGRRKVAALLDEMERSEQNEHPETAFDFGELRAKLGLV